MVRRLEHEEHGPERDGAQLGYDKSTRSFIMRKIPDSRGIKDTRSTNQLFSQTQS